MYVILDKKSKAVLHMFNSLPGQDRKPEELLPGFDSKTMVFARAPEQFLPPRFDIKDGVVVDLDAPPAQTAPPAGPMANETLAQARERKKQEFTGQALALRSELAPDYQLLNAGLGVYDDGRVQSLRATVNAFRDEVARLEAAIAKAKSVAELDALKPAFPTALVVPKPAPTKAK